MTPDPNSVRLMRVIDGMTPEFRALVHEFGLTKIDAMMQDGWTNAGKIRKALEASHAQRRMQCDCLLDWAQNA